MPAPHDAPVRSSSPTRLATLPILILNAHSRCNCRCVMCDIWKRESNDQIRAQDLERHRTSIENLGVRQVVLTGGEPLLNNDLSALCNFFRDRQIHLTLLTTGLLLHKRAEEVPSMPITCRTTVQKANHRHLRQTVDAARALGLDSISFLAADLTSEAFNRPLIWPGEKQSEIGLNPKEVSALEEEIEQLILQYEAGIDHKYIAESASKLRRIARRFREHLGQLTPQAPICNAPWVSAVVEVDGSVRPCFFHRTIGNITSSTLEEVINGEAAQEFRQSLDIENDATCRRCVCSLSYREN